MLRLVDLANRSDFSIGSLRVSPARRLLSGSRSATVEPIVMKVLLLLFDARGNVVTRAELFASAWGDVFVGDDSLNRAVARARKILGEVAPGEFEMETIPRTGYRLTGEALASANPIEMTSSTRAAGVSRRAVIGSAAGAVLAGVSGFGLWSKYSNDRRFKELVRRGKEALEYGDGSPAAADYLRQAVAIRPDDAGAQGLLAYALMYTRGGVNKVAPAGGVQEAQNAVNVALRLNPGEPNARLAQIELQRAVLDLVRTEDKLRSVLATAPDDIFAMQRLWNLLQSTGRSRDGLAVAQRAMALKPLAATVNFPLAQFLWIVGETAEADRVIDRAMDFWPAHAFVRFVRFTIFAFTGRPRSALAMLDSADTRPQNFSPAHLALYRASLAALDQPSEANVAKAVAANLAAVKRDPQTHAPQAMLSLCALKQVDAAFEVADLRLLFRDTAGSRAGDGRRNRRANSTAWPFTPFLFTPPVAPMRADPRFAALAQGIGLTAYWRTRHIRPDYQVFG